MTTFGPDDDVAADFAAIVAQLTDAPHAPVNITRFLKHIANAVPVWDERMVCGTCAHAGLVEVSTLRFRCRAVELVDDVDMQADFGCARWEQV